MKSHSALIMDFDRSTLNHCYHNEFIYFISVSVFVCLFVFFHVNIQLLFKSPLEFYTCDWITTPFRGGSRGRVQGVHGGGGGGGGGPPPPPPPPEMTCGFLIQLVFCQKKNYVVYWC